MDFNFNLQTFHECSIYAFCKGNGLNCYMGVTLLSEGLRGFWLCESHDSLLPISKWITARNSGGQ